MEIYHKKKQVFMMLYSLYEERPHAEASTH